MLRDNHPWWRQAMIERGKLIEPEPRRIRLRHKVGLILIAVSILTACAVRLF